MNPSGHRSRLVVGLLAGVLFAPTSLAGKWECGERSNLPIEGRTYCAASDFRQTDKAMSKLLARVVERQRQAHGSADALTAAQRAFELYRDGHCAATLKRIEGEPFHGMAMAQCRTRRNGQRMDELKIMLTETR